MNKELDKMIEDQEKRLKDKTAREEEEERLKADKLRQSYLDRTGRTELKP